MAHPQCGFHAITTSKDTGRQIGSFPSFRGMRAAFLGAENGCGGWRHGALHVHYSVQPLGLSPHGAIVPSPAPLRSHHSDAMSLPTGPRSSSEVRGCGLIVFRVDRAKLARTITHHLQFRRVRVESILTRPRSSTYLGMTQQLYNRAPADARPAPDFLAAWVYEKPFNWLPWIWCHFGKNLHRQSNVGSRLSTYGGMRQVWCLAGGMRTPLPRANLEGAERLESRSDYPDSLSLPDPRPGDAGQERSLCVFFLRSTNASVCPC